jgi:hypothetical protein
VRPSAIRPSSSPGSPSAHGTTATRAVAQRRIGVDVEAHERDLRARRGLADRTGPPGEIHHRYVRLGRAVELDDPRHREALLELLPHVGAQPVAEREAQLVRALLRVRRLIDEIAAQLADVLERSGTALDHVVPEPARAELARERERRAAAQHRVHRDHAADRVVERQRAVEHVALRETCEQR